MAEGFANLLGKGRIEAVSAGVAPKAVHPLAVRVMSEVGVDISKQQSKAMETFQGQGFDFVITVCDRAKEQCPVWPGIRERIHWSVDDPAEAQGTEEQLMVVFRRVRDGLRQRIRLFLTANHLT
jgi:arsenate reductase